MGNSFPVSKLNDRKHRQTRCRTEVLSPCFEASSVPWTTLEGHFTPGQDCPVQWIPQALLGTYSTTSLSFNLQLFPNSAAKPFCGKLNPHLLVYPLWTRRRASSVYRKAAVTLFSSSPSRLNRTNSLDLSSCSMFSIPLIILFFSSGLPPVCLYHF